MFDEQPFDLPARDTRLGGDVIQVELFVDIVFERLDDRHQGFVANAQGGRTRTMLRFGLGAVQRIDTHVQHRLAEMRAEPIMDQAQEQIGGRRPPRGRQDTIINDIELFLWVMLWIDFAKRGDVFPVQREGFAFQNSRPCQGIGHCAQLTDRTALAPVFAQPIGGYLVAGLLGLNPGTDEYPRVATHIVQRA